jgi:dTDP-4-dehydrorhamnose reductase
MEYVQPSIVFNCAGISDPDLCEKDPEQAFAVNAMGAGMLAEVCSEMEAKLVHFSTWAVFGGDSGRPHKENGEKAPTGEYGRSKAEGERMVIYGAPDSLIIRSGWLFGGEDNGTLQSWTRNASRGARIRVRKDKKISPTCVSDLALFSMFMANIDAKGVYNFANDGNVTMGGFAREVLRETGMNPELVMEVEDDRFDSPWPGNGALACSKQKRATKTKARPWRDAMKQCLVSLSQHS